MLSSRLAMEISEAVDEHRRVIARLEGDLAPRRHQEARELAELETKVAATNGRRAALEKRLEAVTTQQGALTAALARLEDGQLSRERRAWVRVAVPTVASLLLLVALMSIGLSGGRSWWWVLLLGGLGFAAGRRMGRPRE